LFESKPFETEIKEDKRGLSQCSAGNNFSIWNYLLYVPESKIFNGLNNFKAIDPQT